MLMGASDTLRSSYETEELSEVVIPCEEIYAASSQNGK